MMTVHSSDVIDSLVGITPGDSLDRLRENRSEARHHAEGAFRALFSPSRPGAVSPSERLSVAVFVAVLHQVYSAIDYYSLLLRAAEGGGESLLAVVLDGAWGAQTTGPFGRRDALDSQSVEVSEWVLDRENVTDRIASALEYSHFLVFHPHDASRSRLQQLLDSGWTTDGVITLTQLVSFLTFQLRVVLGLSALKGSIEAGNRG